MLNIISVSDYFAHKQDNPSLIDVRAPKEYAKGHIPGAHSMPLFDDAERAIVGTLYKEEGQSKAFLKGLDIVGPKMSNFVQKAWYYAQEKKLSVHCWRGGMRSQSLAQLWQAAGIDVDVIKGGYKAYRQQVHIDLAKPLSLIVLGGKTGSGKTELLHHLADLGEQIIDLEGLAHHKGSVFGGIGQKPQPTTEQFENDLHEQIIKLDSNRRIWLEDEGHKVGAVVIPPPLWEQMKKAKVLVIEVPKEVRVQRLVTEYSLLDEEALANATGRIKKRLGGLRHQRALDALEKKDYKRGAAIALKYYDTAYNNCLKKRPSSGGICHLNLGGDDYKAHAKDLVRYLDDETGYLTSIKEAKIIDWYNSPRPKEP